MSMTNAQKNRAAFRLIRDWAGHIRFQVESGTITDEDLEVFRRRLRNARTDADRQQIVNGWIQLTTRRITAATQRLLEHRAAPRRPTRP